MLYFKKRVCTTASCSVRKLVIINNNKGGNYMPNNKSLAEIFIYAGMNGH